MLGAHTKPTLARREREILCDFDGRVILVLCDGETFGESGLLENEPTSAFWRKWFISFFFTGESGEFEKIAPAQCSAGTVGSFSNY